MISRPHGCVRRGKGNPCEPFRGATPTGDLRILIDQPDELLASDDSDPYFAIAIVSNGSTIVVRDATAPERGHEGNAGVTDTAARSPGLGERADTLRA